MKVAVSYFAQIRNFKPNMIPISTAIHDPKWFHDNRSFSHKFIDKRGVLNGVRCKELAPGESCSGLCGGKDNCSEQPKYCAFLNKYYEQLQRIDKECFKIYCNKVATVASDYLSIPVDDIMLVFVVYEKYDNPCSERSHLIDFLNSCGYNAKELEYPII